MAKSYDPKLPWLFKTEKKKNKFLALYLPKSGVNTKELQENLENLDFRRVSYPRVKFGKGMLNTPRETYCCGTYSDEIVEFRGMHFFPEKLPEWAENLCKQVNELCQKHLKFDPKYNSLIIGRYKGSDDMISFHKDDEKFLEHFLCANLVVGLPRAFQFRDAPWEENCTAGNIHEIWMLNGSILFFEKLSHSCSKKKTIPKEIKEFYGDCKYVPEDAVRYSVSLRSMKTHSMNGKIVREKYKSLHPRQANSANHLYYLLGQQSAIEKYYPDYLIPKDKIVRKEWTYLLHVDIEKYEKGEISKEELMETVQKYKEKVDTLVPEII